MSELLSSVSEHLLAPGGVTIESLQGVLGDLAGPGIDAADLYFQGQISESWALEDGIVKEGSFNLDQGVGVRAQSGEKTGFAYSNAITLEALGAAARAARSISRAGQNGTVQAFTTQDVAQLYGPDNPLEVMTRAEKVELLKRIDVATRALDPRIQQVTVSMAGVWERILIASTDGGLAADVRPLVRFNVSVIVEQNGRRERGGPCRPVDLPGRTEWHRASVHQPGCGAVVWAGQSAGSADPCRESRPAQAHRCRHPCP